MTAGSADILLVEDNPRDLKLALHAFAQHRLDGQVHVARDGAEALDYLFGTGAHAGRDPAQRPRLVVLDLKLPRIDGTEVLRRVRADPRTQTIPVVVLTSSREETDIDRCYRLGANSYIVKPVEFDRFLEVSRQLGTYWLVINQAAST
jgi:two-component system, response regulator